MRARHRRLAALPAMLVALAACVGQALPSSSPPPSASATAVQLPTVGAFPIVPPSPAAASPSPEAAYIEDLSEAEFLLPPTWQWVGQDRAVLSMEFDRRVFARVFCASEENPSSWTLITPAAEGLRLLTEVGGLEPGSSYQCAVGAADDPDSVYRNPAYRGEAWNPLALRMLPAVPGRVRAAAIGDSGFGEEVTAQLARSMAAEKPDLVIHLGDIVYRAHEERDVYLAYARKYFQPLAPVLRSMPVYPVVGNHELDAPVQVESGPFYAQAFPPLPEGCCPGLVSSADRLWYAVRLGDVQLILLNSQAFYGFGDQPAQTAWLGERLADPAYHTHVAAMHIAPFAAGLHVTDGLPLQARWHPLFRDAPVPLVLSGHDHNYQHLEVDGVHYVVSGGGSGVLYPQTVNLAGGRMFRSESHFLIIDFAGGQVSVRALGPTGDLLDAFQIPGAP